ADVVVIVVRDVEETVVGRDEDAVGPLQLPAEDARDLAVRVDAVDALNGLALLVEDLHAGAVAVARVGEVDPALGVEREVVRRVVALALVAVGEDGDLAVGLGAGDAAEVRLAGEQPALLVEEQAVGARALAVNLGPALAVELADVAVAAGQHPQLR